MKYFRCLFILFLFIFLFLFLFIFLFLFLFLFIFIFLFLFLSTFLFLFIFLSTLSVSFFFSLFLLSNSNRTPVLNTDSIANIFAFLYKVKLFQSVLLRGLLVPHESNGSLIQKVNENVYLS